MKRMQGFVRLQGLGVLRFSANILSRDYDSLHSLFSGVLGVIQFYFFY